MTKILGLDLGTASIGWALVERNDTEYALLDQGVDIFQEGVAREKNSEKPAVQDRTAARALRRHYARRRLRKIDLLRVLVRHDLCPALTDEQLKDWKQKKIYPLTDEFIRWQRTDDRTDKNPYRDRYKALTETLDLDTQRDRYTLGRALYHLAQRRGFLSNRKDAGDESESGKVRQSIEGLTVDMEKAGCAYLGEYFYRLYARKEKIRTKYTSRNEHYLAEFRAICEKQRLADGLRKALHRAIFYQRPLKSQKGSVGRCTFEKDKSRCPASHPRFEEFRMLSFINNIRITTPDDPEPRPLSRQETETILPLFTRKTKPHFDFEEIAKKLAGKGRYACQGDRGEAPYRFNFARTATVTGCPVTASLIALFGDDYLTKICDLYTLGAGKTREQILGDVWHALFSFDDEERLSAWAKQKLRLSDDEAGRFAAIRLPQDYAALSLHAINKILPYLREGYRYDEAVFVANLKAVLPSDIYSDESERSAIEADITALITDFRRNPLNRGTTREQCVRDYLRNCRGIDEKRLGRLYHPSMIEIYQTAQPDAQGVLQLGSPRTPAVRNPMAMRALFRLRVLVNRLLRDGKIDRETKIHIEFARGLNDANRRKAIELYQRDREAERKAYADEIRRQYASESGREIEPTDDDILKYRLWKEQNHICPYTGKQIGLSDFMGDSARFDIEHTVPRARGGDNSQMNKTLCESRFNRELKRDKLPSELPNHADVMARIEELGWPEKIAGLQKQIEIQRRKSKSATTKSEKDGAIQRRHVLQMQLDYWRGKYERFTMTEVPDGFSNRQGVDIGIIGKYARLYLKTVFERIYTVKGATTAEFRRMWGLQEEYARKERVNHTHHCLDAIVIACIGRNEYDRWAQYAGDEERYRRGEGAKPRFEKPWPTFTEDLEAVADRLLVAHHTPDNMPKQSRKRLRIRGRIRTGRNGETLYAQGDTARGALHQQTFYGAIERQGEVRYVVRKPLGQLQLADVDNIVDDAVRQKVKEAIDAVGFKTAMDTESHPIWMNEQKRVPIRKVRIFAGKNISPKSLGGKKHRDLSALPHKRPVYVSYGSNYCMAVYEGEDKRGKLKRTFEIVSTLEAAQYFKASADKAARPDLVPQSDANGFPLKCILKTGTMVLFYEETPEELYECTQQELAKRLYKLTKFSSMTTGNSSYGSCTFRHHQEARPAKELKPKGGTWKVGEAYRPIISLLHTQLNAYVEGFDFELSVTGTVRFKHE